MNGRVNFHKENWHTTGFSKFFRCIIKSLIGAFVGFLHRKYIELYISLIELLLMCPKGVCVLSLEYLFPSSHSNVVSIFDCEVHFLEATNRSSFLSAFKN